MGNINVLYNAIASLLASEKAYDLPAVCFRYGMDHGEEYEAFKSKHTYVSKRLKAKSSLFITALAKQLIEEYNSPEFAIVAERFISDSIFKISTVSRRRILDELSIRGRVEGELDIVVFVGRFWDTNAWIHEATLETDLRKHMIANDDWDYNYLFDNVLNLIYVSDEIFFNFLENIVHPSVRKNKLQNEYVEWINIILINDGYKLEISNYISGFAQYKIEPITGGVVGNIKNLIFSADGPKPEIIFSDALNNDIKIVKNEEYCLVFDRAIPHAGLLWCDLVDWWDKSKNMSNLDKERNLYIRLLKSLDSEPEKLFFHTYYKICKKILKNKLPALIPQVYLHYDPYTLKNLKGVKRLSRQRMDFLILLSDKKRIVIEIDGKQHYSKDNIAKPEYYSDLVAEDRNLKLKGYEVYRFGGYELTYGNKEKIVEEFFTNLFRRHRIIG